ncbi:uncharacterized protein UTRI_02788 [Ustilago trichophora]|uniref:Uncharacterized protein n=1 Tax=Ustilago trichophora TaxID=86804 RepID=A0A5C3ES58_9BASI|nr:uncharacterized protein UTRI_02788 [Ustilago trichophora]
MFATTDDLKLCSRASGQPLLAKHHSSPAITTVNHTSKPKAKPLLAASPDSADEIQVIEEEQTAIPIRTALGRWQSDRHSDLDIGSVHSHKRRSSPLFERRKRDDLDFLTDFGDSSDDEYNGSTARDQNARGRERRTKPLLRPKQISPPHRPQRYDYAVADVTAYSPQLGDHPDRCCTPNGRRSLYELDGTPRHTDRYSAKDTHHKLARHHRRAPPPASTGLEHEAMVFDNFEDISSVSSASEHEQENEDCFDPHLHFVRPAMSICANPGAFVTLEPLITPGGSSSEGLGEGADADELSAQRKRHRLGHHRAVSELFSTSKSDAKPTDIRVTRRRATVGAEAAYRLPSFTRQADLSA